MGSRPVQSGLGLPPVHAMVSPEGMVAIPPTFGQGGGVASPGDLEGLAVAEEAASCSAARMLASWAPASGAGEPGASSEEGMSSRMSELTESDQSSG